MPPKKKQAQAASERKVIYPEVSVDDCRGESAMQAEAAMEYLGWEEESAGVKFGSDFLFTDRNGNKIRCLNNVTNRPLYMSSVEALVQEHLQRRWRFNGEPIIIGVTGLVLNGQHTLISLVLAEQDRTGKDTKQHWEALWDGPVTMEKLVIKGIAEDDATVNTMDTCKPRSLADVIYRSEYFKTMKPSDRKMASRMCDYAIRLLWKRTGYADKHGFNAYAVRRTHSESLDFIARHPKLLKAVKHIMEEDGEQKVSQYMPGRSAGTAAGLLYLMATAASDGDTYRNADTPTEKLLDLDLWEKACEFFVLLGSKGKVLRHVPIAIAGLEDPNTGEGGTSEEKLAVIIKAWNVFKEGHHPTPSDLQLKRKPVVVDHVTDEQGNDQPITRNVMDEHPVIGGIDLGDPEEVTKQRKEDEDEARARAEEEAAEETALTEEEELNETEKAKLQRKKDVDDLKKRVEAKRQEMLKKIKEDEKAETNGEAEAKQGKAAANGEPAKKPKRVTRKQVEAAQTEKARKADEQKAKEEAAAKEETPAKEGPAKKTVKKPKAKKPEAAE